jgi:hypothetical protein
MVNVKHSICFLCIGLGLLSTLAFIPLQNAPESPVFFDDFEEYLNNKDIKKAYIVWEDGAVLNVTLQNTRVYSGKQALDIEIVSTNPSNQSINGSIYHILPRSQRNWSQGSQIRFWVNNTSENNLLLSFNFKEEFNEYWAINSSGVFFLQSEEGDLLQQEILYGNLPIPANYRGFVVVPFYSFTVPDWNTARGDRIMNLARIESYAIAVNIAENSPSTFTIDDIEVLAFDEMKTLEIQGVKSILVPPSGEHREQYTAFLSSLAKNTSENVSAIWSLRQPYDPLIKIDSKGNLTIPAGIQSSSIILAATYTSQENSITKEFTIVLDNGQSSPEERTALETLDKPTQVVDSTDYQSSKAFEAWATENRVLFVIISVSAILLILSLLSFFQRRIK